VNLNFAELFGKQKAFLNRQEPVCAMLMKGPELKMVPHQRLKPIGDEQGLEQRASEAEAVIS
jgi:hypothetical protein